MSADWTDPRTGLRRRKPLRARSTLRASNDTTPARIVRLRRSQAARRADARLAESAQTVIRRAEVAGRPACERCGVFADRLEMSHRKPRSAFGPRNPARDAPSNLLALCAPCHRTGTYSLHAAPERARDNGWVVGRREDPLTVPVRYRGRMALLDDDGGVIYA